MMMQEDIIDNELDKIHHKNENDRLIYLQRKNTIFRRIINFFYCKNKVYEIL